MYDKNGGFHSICNQFFYYQFKIIKNNFHKMLAINILIALPLLCHT